MLQNRKLIHFLLITFLLCKILWAEISLKGVRIAPSLPETWTSVGFTLENLGRKEQTLLVKVVAGAIESASSFSAELKIPAKCSWNMSFPVFAPSRQTGKNGPIRRKFEATVYLHQGGALLHREVVLGPLLRNNPVQFLSEDFKKPSNQWSVDGLWNTQAWGHQHGKIQPDYLKRRLRGQFTQFSEPFIVENLQNRIIVLESLEDLGPLETSELLKWMENGGLFILSESRTNRHVLHENLGFLPTQKTWSAPSQKKKPFTGTLHEFSSSWKSWVHRSDTLGAWREVAHGAILVTKIPLRELLGQGFVHWSDITDKLLPPSPNQLLREAGGKEWMQTELMRETRQGMWSRNWVGAYLSSLIIFAIALCQLPFFKEKRELRWLAWCALSLIWCFAGFIFHLFNTDASTRMESVEMVIKKVSTPGATSQGLSRWQSGSKRRLDLKLDGIDWTISGSQEATFSPNHWGLKGWELRPGENKLLGFERKAIELSINEPKLKLGIRPKLNIPKALIGHQANLVIGNHFWDIESLQPEQRMDPNTGTSIKDASGPVPSLVGKWLLEKDQKFLRPTAWLILKNPAPSNGLTLPQDIVKKSSQWLWYVFPTSHQDSLKIKKWASTTRLNIGSSLLAHQRSLTTLEP